TNAGVPGDSVVAPYAASAAGVSARRSAGGRTTGRPSSRAPRAAASGPAVSSGPNSSTRSYRQPWNSPLLERATDPIGEPLRTLARPIGGGRMRLAGLACVVAHQESREYPGEAELAAIDEEHLERSGRRGHESRGSTPELR